MQFFEYKSAKFPYTDVGQGPAIIFLHGFLENQYMWTPLINTLPKGYRKICLDLPGHGDAPNLGYIHTMEEMAVLVKSLIDKLKLKKVFLAGHSMGGYVALAFAEKYPDNIRAIILQNSTARADSESKKKDRDRAIQLVKQNHKSFIRIAIPNLFRPKNRLAMKEAVKEVKNQALKTSKQGIVAALEGMKIRADREVLLHFAPYPILFIAAKHDPILAFEALSEQMQAEKVQGLITSNGHMSHIEDLDIYSKTLKAFLKETL